MFRNVDRLPSKESRDIRNRLSNLLTSPFLDEMSIRLNPGGNLSCANRIEPGDVLAKNGFIVLFSKTLRVELSSPDPDSHLEVTGHKSERAHEGKDKRATYKKIGGNKHSLVVTSTKRVQFCVCMYETKLNTHDTDDGEIQGI